MITSFLRVVITTFIMGKFTVQSGSVAKDAVSDVTVPDNFKDEIITEIELVINPDVDGGPSFGALIYRSTALLDDPIAYLSVYNNNRNGLWLPAKDLKIRFSNWATNAYSFAVVFTTSDKARKGLYVR